jgi:hypothetical protein
MHPQTHTSSMHTRTPARTRQQHTAVCVCVQYTLTIHTDASAAYLPRTGANSSAYTDVCVRADTHIQSHAYSRMLTSLLHPQHPHHTHVTHAYLRSTGANSSSAYCYTCVRRKPIQSHADTLLLHTHTRDGRIPRTGANSSAYCYIYPPADTHILSHADMRPTSTDTCFFFFAYLPSTGANSFHMLCRRSTRACSSCCVSICTFVLVQQVN